MDDNELNETFRDLSQVAVATIKELMEDGKTDTIRFKAAAFVIAQGYGKPGVIKSQSAAEDLTKAAEEMSAKDQVELLTGALAAAELKLMEEMGLKPS